MTQVTEAKILVLKQINDVDMELAHAIAAALKGSWLVTPRFVMSWAGACIKLKEGLRTKRRVYCSDAFQHHHAEIFGVLKQLQRSTFRLIGTLEEFVEAKQLASDRSMSASVIALVRESEKCEFDGISHCWTPEEFRGFVFQVDLEKSCQGR